MEFDIPVKSSGIRTFDFKSSIGTKEQKANVDRESRVVKDVILVSVGEAKGWGYSIEATFLLDMMKYIRAHMGGRIQCNMGHRWDANFFQLGRFDNARLSSNGNSIIGDLTVYEAADKSPALQGMADWFMSIAAEDPEAVMCSIKGNIKGCYQYDDHGNKVYIQYRSWSGPEKQFPKKPAFVEFKDLTSCDIVDNGALTDALYSENGMSQMGYELARIINTPGFMQFFKANEDQFPEIHDHFQHKFKFSLPKIIANLFSNSKEMDDKKSQAADTAESKTPVEASAPAADLTAAIEAAVKPLRDEIDSMKTQLAAKDGEIAELKKKPAAAPVGVKAEGDSRQEMAAGDNADQPWMNSAMNRRIAEINRKQPAKA